MTHGALEPIEFVRKYCKHERICSVKKSLTVGDESKSASSTNIISAIDSLKCERSVLGILKESELRLRFADELSGNRNRNQHNDREDALQEV